jgi:hypothetical protein
MRRETATKQGFPFLSILTLIFITLKLTGYIAWSWWWVLSPIWIPIALVLTIWLLVCVLTEFTRRK